VLSMRCVGRPLADTSPWLMHAYLAFAGWDPVTGHGSPKYKVLEEVIKSLP
jgi:hypothetical protein